MVYSFPDMFPYTTLDSLQDFNFLLIMQSAPVGMTWEFSSIISSFSDAC